MISSTKSAPAPLAHAPRKAKPNPAETPSSTAAAPQKPSSPTKIPAFEATVQGWLTAYNPDTQPAITLVENLARAHWVLKRNEKRLEEVEWELPANAYDWTDEHHKLYSTTNRYKTTAERSFLRYFQRSRSTLPTACTATTTPANSLSP
ncbi:MAG: hypothetical protein ACR2JB_30670, partial [Bryobacteraceae bacterium]